MSVMQGSNGLLVNASLLLSLTHLGVRQASWQRIGGESPVCTENLIRVDDVMESLKLAE
jgi:hypothetical protein